MKRTLSPSTRRLVGFALSLRGLQPGGVQEPDPKLVAKLTRTDLLDVRGFASGRLQEVSEWLAANRVRLKDVHTRRSR